MREYLDLEFQALKTTLPFEYNLENIIDDWVSFILVKHKPFLQS